jgi:hypothetical protein
MNLAFVVAAAAPAAGPVRVAIAPATAANRYEIIARFFDVERLGDYNDS